MNDEEMPWKGLILVRCKTVSKTDQADALYSISKH